MRDVINSTVNSKQFLNFVELFLYYTNPDKTLSLQASSSPRVVLVMKCPIHVCLQGQLCPSVNASKTFLERVACM